MEPLVARLAGDMVAHAHTVTAESNDFPRMSAGRLVTTSHHKLIRDQPKDVAGLKGYYYYYYYYYRNLRRLEMSIKISSSTIWEHFTVDPANYLY